MPWLYSAPVTPPELRWRAGAPDPPQPSAPSRASQVSAPSLVEAPPSAAAPARERQQSQPSEPLKLFRLPLPKGIASATACALPAEAWAVKVTGGKPKKPDGLFEGGTSSLLAKYHGRDPVVEFTHESSPRSKMQADSGETASMCLAVCPARSIWGVGIATRPKIAEAAARLALAAAVVTKVGRTALRYVGNRWPAMFRFFFAAGALPTGAVKDAKLDAIVSQDCTKTSRELKREKKIVARQCARAAATAEVSKRIAGAKALPSDAAQMATATAPSAMVPPATPLGAVPAAPVLTPSTQLLAAPETPPLPCWARSASQQRRPSELPMMFRLPLPKEMASAASRSLAAEAWALKPRGALPKRVPAAADSLIAKTHTATKSPVEYTHMRGFPSELKAAADDEVDVCLAVHKKLGIWGVGITATDKASKAAARVALAATILATADQSTLQRVRHCWPAMLRLCSAAGALSAQGEDLAKTLPETKKVARAAAEADASKTSAGAPHAPEASPPDAAQPTAPMATSLASPPGSVLPRDTPVWIELPREGARPAQLEGLQGRALVLSADVGGAHQEIYRLSHASMMTLLPILGVDSSDYQAVVEFTDDDGQIFPAIAQQLARHAPEPEQICVVTCPAIGMWAVGVSNRPPIRRSASKAALCASMFLAAVEAGADLGVLKKLPWVAQLAGQARRARAVAAASGS